MTNSLRLALTGLVLAATLALAACGGSEPDAAPAAAPAPAEPPAPPAELTVEEALASPPEGLVTVTGFILAADGEPVRLCAALAESYPPQCGVASLVVEGLDLDTVEGLTRAEEPAYAHTAWTDAQVSLTGEIVGGTLAVSQSGP
jgi:hypothetical protein